MLFGRVSGSICLREDDGRRSVTSVSVSFLESPPPAILPTLGPPPTHCPPQPEGPPLLTAPSPTQMRGMEEEVKGRGCGSDGMRQWGRRIVGWGQTTEYGSLLRNLDMTGLLSFLKNSDSTLLKLMGSHEGKRIKKVCLPELFLLPLACEKLL